MAISFLKQSTSISRISKSPILTLPVFGSKNLYKRRIKVDFPEPDPPTTATRFPAGTVKLRSSKILFPLMYSKQTFSNVMLLSLAIAAEICWASGKKIM